MGINSKSGSHEVEKVPQPLYNGLSRNNGIPLLQNEEENRLEESETAIQDFNAMKNVRAMLGVGPEREEGFDAGLQTTKRKVDVLLAARKSVLMSIAGKTGSGKTVFANQLRDMLAADGTHATIISSDDYYKEDGKTLDLEELQKTILRLRAGEKVGKLEPAPVLIVEGLQTIEDETLGQTPDDRVYIEAPSFQKRIAGRLLRDEESGFRTIREALSTLTSLSAEDLKRFKQFEADPDMRTVDRIVRNTHSNPNDPTLYIDRSKNTIVYMVGDEKREEVEIPPSQIPIIANEIGIEMR
jgi:uridine kinase